MFHCRLNRLQCCGSETVPDCSQTDELCGSVVNVLFFQFYSPRLLLDLDSPGRCPSAAVCQLNPTECDTPHHKSLILTIHPVFVFFFLFVRKGHNWCSHQSLCQCQNLCRHNLIDVSAAETKQQQPGIFPLPYLLKGPELLLLISISEHRCLIIVQSGVNTETQFICMSHCLCSINTSVVIIS